MTPEDVLYVLKMKKIKHSITNCDKLKQTDVEFIKTLDNNGLMELIFHYDHVLEVLTNVFCD